jgi:putative colanic acid biosynthesis acetyltransferase WcaF
MISENSTSELSIKNRLRTLAQDSAYSSPWPKKVLVSMALWEAAWLLLCRWTPKPLYRWRSVVAKTFGARIDGKVFIASSAHIKMPWNLTLSERACIGNKVEVYNLAPVSIGRRATIAQEVYICAGTHKFDDPNLPLVVGPVDVGADAFVGARAFLSPGVRVGAGAIIGACSVVTRDIPAWTVAAGNPSRVLKIRSRQSSIIHEVKHEEQPQ